MPGVVWLTLTVLLLAPPAGRHAERTLPVVPVFEKLRVGFFQFLDNRGTMTSND